MNNLSPRSSSPAIETNDLSVTYRQFNTAIEALQRVSFSLARGDTCCVIGPSGCGKTTLLYALAGLVHPVSGEVTVFGEIARPKRRDVALILQDYGLLPWKTVWQNVALGLQIRGTPVSEQRRLVGELLYRLGIAELGNRYPKQLSGGQRQRVAIARSLAHNPELLLMDEPFSSLDALTREELQDTLLQVWRRTGLTIVLVTHSIEEAVFLGRKVLVLSPRPGRLLAEIENHNAGDADFRSRPEFHRRCNQIRGLFERGVRGG